MFWVFSLYMSEKPLSPGNAEFGFDGTILDEFLAGISYSIASRFNPCHDISSTISHIILCRSASNSFAVSLVLFPGT